MDIKQAKALRPGARVSFSEDRGVPSGQGPVVAINPTTHTTHIGHEYVWVEVYMCTQQHAALWPSNRLTAS